MKIDFLLHLSPTQLSEITLVKSSTIASAFVHSILEGATAKGYDINQILRESEISPNVLQYPKSRVTFRQMELLGKSLADLLNDENYGLTDKPQRKNTYKLICHSIISADTVEEALKLYVEFLNMLDDSLEYELVEETQHLTLQLTRRPARSIKNNYVIEHILLVIHRTLCWLANTQISILCANLDYSEPDHSKEYRYIFYNASVFFDQQHCSISFNHHYLQLENVRTKDDLEDFLDHPSLVLLSRTYKTENLSTQLRTWLERQLTRYHSAPNIDIAAAHFELHPQAMRRQLKKEGPTYQDIKMEIQRDLAINLISHQKDSVESIAFQLDFSESRAFIRAFKRWTGLTPLAYKKLSKLHQDWH